MLQLKFTICHSSGCNRISFSDKTGTYSTENITGYGTPNPNISEAESATLTITPLNGDQTVIDLFENYPNNNTDNTFELPVELSDGIYTFQYQAVISGLTYSQIITKLFVCQSECCIQKLFAKVSEDTGCTSCTETKSKEANFAKTLLHQAKIAAKKGQSEKAQNLLNQVIKICKTNKCHC